MPTMKNERIPTNDNLQIPVVVSIVFLSILGLAVRPPLLRKVIFATILFLSYFWLWKTQSDNLVKDYSLGLWVATNVFCLNDLVGLCSWDGDVQKAVVRKRKDKKVTGRNGWVEREMKEGVGKKEGEEGKEEIWTQPFIARLQWALELWNAKRGVGWEHEVPGLRNRSNSTSRTRRKTLSGFILAQITELTKCGLLYFIGDVLMQMNPSFLTHGPAFNEQVWWLKPTVLGHVLAARGSINATYVVGSALWVLGRVALSGVNGKGKEDMEDLLDEWPPLFGSFLEVWSVRNVWR
ncbi:hypothetical protein H1R20_g10454, partial [Candolleomyces eurysporus]